MQCTICIYDLHAFAQRNTPSALRGGAPKCAPDVIASADPGCLRQGADSPSPSFRFAQ
ncbi:hypothetical protein MPC1_1430004 [Methylocella tundrae]|nr:hypothetical protein MPC1_1430004 [Methylocella tundrae]